MTHEGARAVTSSERPPGSRVAEYVLEAPLAEGSMGRVYRALHVETQQPVALKVLHPGVALDHVSVERFRREHETASSLVHPNIVRVFDFGETGDGSYFIAMEFLDGEELGVLTKQTGPMPPARMLPILCQLALGLDYAHQEGVIHRDLKPANVFVCRTESRDDVRIVDFGSVKLQLDTGPKLTALGTTLGSPYYMSPEQAMGLQDVDPRSDVFALGAIIYELCTGSIAFGAPSTAEILEKVTSQDPAPVSTLNVDYPWGFDAVVKRALSKDKSDRFPTTMALAEAALHAFGVEPDVRRCAALTKDALAGDIARPPVGRPEPEPSPEREPSVPPPPMRRASPMTKWAVAAAVVVCLGMILWWITG